MAEAKEEVKLTKQELQTLINICANAQVKVSDAPVVIALINKLSLMVDRSQ